MSNDTDVLNDRISKLENIRDKIILKIDEIKRESDKDLQINETDLDSASIDTPKLFSKYNNMFSDEMIVFRKLIQQKDKVYLERVKWMLGKQTNKYYSDYGIYQEKVLKSEIDMYIKSDSIYSLMNEIVSIQKILVDAIEKICQEIKNRGYHIKTAVEWRKFVAGA